MLKVAKTVEFLYTAHRGASNANIMCNYSTGIKATKLTWVQHCQLYLLQSHYFSLCDY